MMHKIVVSTLVVIAFFKLKSTSGVGFSQSALNLETGLQVFENCTINIVTNHVDELARTADDLTYDIVPLKFPVMLLSLKYQLSYIGHELPERLFCAQYPVELIPNQNGYKFVAKPSPKQTCFVMVYIDPKPCKYWRHTIRFADDAIGRLRHKLFPSTFFNPVVESFNLGPTGTLFKSGIYFLQVEIFKSEKYYKNIELSNIRTIQFLIDLLRPNTFFVKLSMVIEYFPDRNIFSTKYKYLWGCADYNAYNDGVRKYCGDRNEALNPESCEQYISFRMKLHNTNLVEYKATEIQSPTSFDILYLKACTSVSIAIIQTHYLTMPPSAYVLEYKNEHQDLRSVFLEMICGNCTVRPNTLNGLYYFPGLTTYHHLDPKNEFSFGSKTYKMHFVTCFPTKQSGWLSRIGDFWVFDRSTWLIIMFAVVLSDFLLKRTTLKLRSRSSLVYEILLKQNHYIDDLKWVCGAWLLVGVVLTFFYQSDYIYRLTTPLEPKRLQNLDSMLKENFTIYSPIIHPWEFQQLREVGKDFKRYSKLNFFAFASIFIKKHFSLEIFAANAKIQKMFKKPTSWDTLYDMLKPKYFIDQISRCEKDVFVDFASSVDAVKLQLQIRNVDINQLSWSRESYGEVYDSWILKDIPYPPNWFLVRAHSLLHSGIYEFWNDWKDRVLSWKDKIAHANHLGTETKRQASDGNFMVVFYIQLALLALSALAFGIEILAKIGNQLKKTAQFPIKLGEWLLSIS